MGCTSSKIADTDAEIVKPKQVQVSSEISQNDNKVDRKTPTQQEEFTYIDNHARKAPISLKESPQKLVSYLKEASTDPRMMTRAIFVWITENIKYDVDGYFGITQNAPTTAIEVMKCGKSVCQGYANVMELLCREAEIPVKVLSGYAKGYSYSPDKTITTENDTNHAWNAVQLEGKWYLVDCTWAAGHVDRSKGFLKRFQPFYFLTDPEKFIMDHYPYMKNDMKESMKWQLLEHPISLNVFSQSLRLYPGAFELTLNPVSHKTSVVDVQTEEQFTFKNDGMFEIDILASLKHLDRNTLTEQPLNVFIKKSGKIFRVQVHPNKTGTFHLTIFGKNRLKTGDYDQVCEYVLKVGKIDKRDFEFPQQYSIEDECELVKPMQYKLKANSEIEFYLSSPYFLRVMVGDMFLEKAGASFKGTFKTGRKGEDLTLYGSREAEDSLEGLFTFIIV